MAFMCAKFALGRPKRGGVERRAAVPTAAGLKLLRQRLDAIGVAVAHMKDDGNCQFRSLAQVGGWQLHQGTLAFCSD